MRLSILILLTFFYSISYTQQLSWDLSSSGEGVSNHQELECLDFIAGSGLTSFSFGSNGASAKQWTTGGLDENDYFQAAFVSSAQDTFVLNTIEFGERRSGTSIRTYEIRYSNQEDFLLHDTLTVVNVPDNDSERDTTIENLEILIFPQDTLFIRWYAYNAESSTYTWRINNATLKMYLSTYVVDVTAPELDAIEFLNTTSIQMNFDEALDSNSFQLSDFQIDQTINPVSIDKSLSLQGKIILNFANAFPSEQSMSLMYKNIADLEANKIVPERYINITYVATPPILESAEVQGDRQIKMYFNQEIMPDSLELSNFILNESIHPISIDKSNTYNGVLILNYENAFPEEVSLNLGYKNIYDMDGNTISTEQFVELSYYIAKPFYVLINEIMVDPTPRVYLPENEYIELYNNKNFPININHWILTRNTSNYTLPSVEIAANSYLLIVPEDKAAYYDTTLNIIELNFGSLANSEGTIVLKSEDNTWIHQVNYTSEWHSESHKSNGGWSLELIDQTDACNMANNWKSSIDEMGGTPGKVNSVNGDNNLSNELEILNVYFVEDTSALAQVIIQLNQYLSPSFIINSNNYILDGNTATLAEYTQGNSYLSLFFNDVFEENVKYNLIIKDGLETCDGSIIDLPTEVYIGIPSLIDSNDIVINEVLFNPRDDNEKYIEFYNQSEKIIDLQELKLGILEEDLIKPKDVLSDVPMVVFPQDYFVLTKDRNNILAQYSVKNKNRLFNSEEIPSYSTKEDYLFLLNRGDKIIDVMHYSEDYHNPIIADNEGVSLEKTNPKNIGTNRSSWQSASQNTGFGTPTYQNSQFSDISSNIDTKISFESETFSPDMDGYNDYLTINYKLEKSGYTANVKIYNSKGQFILQLVSNEFTGKEGVWTWDGRDVNNNSSALGIYILVFEFIHADGELIQEKKVCTIASKL